MHTVPNIIGTDISIAKKVLCGGGLIGLPTETVYGLAANALLPDAVAKIFEAKQRPAFDPLILHVHDIIQLEDFVETIPQQLWQLGNALWPGPLTLLLPKKNSVPDIVTSGLPNVAIRIPQHPLTLALLEALEFPIAAPSANPFGFVSPTTAKHVTDGLGNKVDYILDGGSCDIGIESTIVGLEQGEVIVYRKGGVAIEELEQYVGKVKVNEHSSSNPAAPGMLKKHYSPGKTMILGDIATELEKFKENSSRIGILSFSQKFGLDNEFVLSETADLSEAAHRLFSGLRFFSDKNIDILLAELVPEEGLGVAINDRLRRAAAK